MKKLIPLLALLLAGCADLNTTSFRSEKLLADSAEASVRGFNLYYHSATNGATPEKIASLNKERDQVYDASRKTAAVLLVVESARIAYSTNASPANEQALTSALAAMEANSAAVTNSVAGALGPFSPVPAASTTAIQLPK